jgi:hypothetical protein
METKHDGWYCKYFNCCKKPVVDKDQQEEYLELTSSYIKEGFDVAKIIKNTHFIAYLRETFFTEKVSRKINKLLFFKFAISRLKKNNRFLR